MEKIGLTNKNESNAPHPLVRGLMKWLLVLLISIWMFVLGVIVGRETVPIKVNPKKDLQDELVQLNKKSKDEEIKEYQIDAEKLFKDNPDLGFHEALKSTKDEPLPMEILVDMPSKESTTTASNQPKTTIPEKTAFLIKKEIPSDKKKTLNAAPPAITKNQEKTQEPEPAITTSKLTVQVASFNSVNEAERLIADLKKKGYSAYQTSAIILGKGMWFRVRVGSFKKRSEADSTVSRLKKEGLHPMIVTSE